MVYEVSAKRRNPWKRELDYNPDYYTPDIKYYRKHLLRKWPKFSQLGGENTFLDIHTKRAVLVASPFVVSLVSYTGEKEMNQGSGFIVATDDTNTGIVFTSANLIRRSTENNVAENDFDEDDFVENELADDLKVQVILADGRSYEGVVCAHDFHYNIAAIRFTSESFVSCAPLKLVDDSVDVKLVEDFVDVKPSFELRRHSSAVKLPPGDVTVVAGRYFTHPYEVMASRGVFRLDPCGYDCKELFNSTCEITRCGDGGPLVNLAGDVIGIAFFDHYFTPFLPINIAYKWWELCKRYGEFRRPSVGFEATNFYAADLDVTDKIIQKFPSISKGLIVKKVIPGSSADSAGLRANDVIIQCGGKEASSFLEFFEKTLDNVGKIVELVVARVGCVTLLYPKMMVGELTSDKLNRWPRRETR